MRQNDERGFIVLWRKTLDSWMWTLPAAYRVLAIHCVLRANWKDKSWWNGTETILIKRGSFYTSRHTLAKELGLTESCIERGLKALKSNTFLDSRSDSKGRLITIVNYERYQNIPTTTEHPSEPLSGQVADSDRTGSGQVADTNNNNNHKNHKNQGVQPPSEVPLSWSDVVAERHPLTHKSQFSKWRGAVEDLVGIGKTMPDLLNKIRGLPANSNAWDLTKLYQPKPAKDTRPSDYTPPSVRRRRCECPVCGTEGEASGTFIPTCPNCETPVEMVVKGG